MTIAQAEAMTENDDDRTVYFHFDGMTEEYNLFNDLIAAQKHVNHVAPLYSEGSSLVGKVTVNRDDGKLWIRVGDLSWHTIFMSLEVVDNIV